MILFDAGAADAGWLVLSLVDSPVGSLIAGSKDPARSRSRARALARNYVAVDVGGLASRLPCTIKLGQPETLGELTRALATLAQ
ncbi:MAG: hypothetical protein AB8H80_17105 [Planctomycetota bacterium]